jgi:hypothetical protein
MSLEIKRDIIKGKIWSYIRSKWPVETPEETVRQKYLLILVNEYSFSLDQIAEELNLTGRGSASARADFVIWRTAKEKVRWTVDYLDRIGHWLGSQGITNLLNPLSPTEQLLETFKAAQSRIPKRVFLARWYPEQDAPDGVHSKATLRLQQLQQTLTTIKELHDIMLELIDMGTEEGGTFPIHSKMYDAIASSDIIICDLTGHRPNVYVEAGYALKHHEKNRLIFLFEPANDDDKVPFDLNTFKYVQITQAAEIPNKLRPEIESILRDSGLSLD